LINFFNLSDNHIYEFHNDLFGEEERSLESIGAIVIGREIRRIVDTNERLVDRLVSMINRYVADSDRSDFIRLMVKETGEDVSEIIGYLNDIFWGIQNPSTVRRE